MTADGHRILVAEDDPDIRAVLVATLEAQGYVVESFADGKAALESVRAAAPDLVISDILMPGLDGFELCRQMKRDETLRHIPFVFYTATYTRAEDRALGLALGAARYIVKPASIEAFLAQIGSVLAELPERAAAAGEAAADAEADAAPAADDETLREMDIETLSAKLRDKVADLEQRTRALEISEQRFRDFARASSDWFWETDTNLMYTWLSDAFEATLGIPGKRLIGRTLGDIGGAGINVDAWARVSADVSARRPFRNVRYAVTRNNGAVVHVALNGVPAYDGDGNFVGYRGTGADVSEQYRSEEALRRAHAELEQRVAERTEALTSANKDLESYAYGISHVLRSPLRTISAFGAILLDEHDDKLSGDARNYLERICRASDAMAKIIDDMLRFTRTTRQPIVRSRVDLSAIARSIVEGWQEEEPTRPVVVAISDGVEAVASEKLIGVVLENLLANAWEFTRNRTPARIEFGTTVGDDEAIYYIRDNGIGFDMAYADKLFVPFQHLHGSRDFEGTGIGLAAVERIIRRHGGQIWAESTVDRGATFYFTLPSPAAGSA